MGLSDLPRTCLSENWTSRDTADRPPKLVGQTVSGSSYLVCRICRPIESLTATPAGRLHSLWLHGIGSSTSTISASKTYVLLSYEAGISRVTACEVLCAPRYSHEGSRLMNHDAPHCILENC